jgi:hypothetical protein
VRRILLLLRLIALGEPLRAQADARFEIVLPPAGARSVEGPALQSDGLLAERQLRELLLSGFPARLHYRLELWSTGAWFDHLRAQEEWDVIVRYNALQHRYTVARVEGDHASSLGTFADIAEVEAAIGQPYQPALHAPRRRDRYYYTAALDVEVLSLSDLDEVERWLRGELRPAVRGEKSPGTAITRGARTLVTRLLGGEERHHEARTRAFRGEQ